MKYRSGSQHLFFDFQVLDDSCLFYLKFFHDNSDISIPHDVVEIIAKEGCNLLRAWRKHLKLTQKEVAQRAGITQSALSQMELSDSVKRSSTLEKLTASMGLEIDHLTD